MVTVRPLSIIVLCHLCCFTSAAAQELPSKDAVAEEFRRRDRDGDGTLLREQLEANVPFDLMDADGDDRLTLAEIQFFLDKLPLERTLPPVKEADLSRPLKPIQQRIADRDFPSVFQAWSPATNLDSEHRVVTIARHDLVFLGPGATGLRWSKTPTGLADGFTPESIGRAERYRATLNALNPNLILLAEIRYRDAMDGYLPADHAWWKRDAQGKRIVGWEEGPAYLLDFANPQLCEQVAGQARAAVESGVFDGVMLDWWSDDKERLALIKAVREAVGPNVVILVNANDRQTPETAPFVNGYFMECWRSETREDWDRIAATLRFAESELRQPRINCLETWYQDSREDRHRMRATTCLVLTQSDGCCLFSDPNDLPSPDHLHDWYPFWDTRLGKPVAAGVIEEDGSSTREFEYGTVVYHPIDNPPKTVRFDEPRRSVSCGRTAMVHEIDTLDGDVFLRPDAQVQETAEKALSSKPQPMPVIRQGLTGWRLLERGAHLIEDFDATAVDLTRWRIWHSNPQQVTFGFDGGRFSIQATGPIGHNGLWQLKARRFKDVTLVGRMDMESDVARSHDLCLHLCGGDMPTSPDHWVEVAMRDLDGDQVEFRVFAAVERDAFTQSNEKVILSRKDEKGFLAKLSLDGGANLCSAEVRDENGKWRAIIVPTALRLRTTHCEVKMRGGGGQQHEAAVSRGWFDDVRIYPRAVAHPILVRLVGSDSQPIFRREGDTWPPRIQVKGRDPDSLEELVLELWTVDGQHRVSRVQSSNFAYYMLPVVHEQWDVFPVAAILRLSYRGESLGEVEIPLDGLNGVYPDDVFELTIE